MRNFKLVINSRAEIIVDDIIYKTIIQDVSDDGFAISIPMANGEYLTLENGQKIEMFNYCDEINLYHLKCEVIKRLENDNIHLYKISMPKEVKKIQRRNFVRVNLSQPVKYVKYDGDDKAIVKHAGLMLDLSGGGMRLKIREAFKMGQQVMVNLKVEELDINIVGEIVRIEKSEDRRYIYGINFCIINNSIREKVIQTVFKIMRKQRLMV